VAPGPVWTGGISRPTRIRSPHFLSRRSVAIPTELPSPPLLHGVSINILYFKSSPGMREERKRGSDWVLPLLPVSKEDS
jgi:hypothetical protein